MQKLILLFILAATGASAQTNRPAHDLPLACALQDSDSFLTETGNVAAGFGTRRTPVTNAVAGTAYALDRNATNQVNALALGQAQRVAATNVPANAGYATTAGSAASVTGPQAAVISIALTNGQSGVTLSGTFTGSLAGAANYATSAGTVSTPAGTLDNFGYNGAGSISNALFAASAGSVAGVLNITNLPPVLSANPNVSTYTFNFPAVEPVFASSASVVIALMQTGGSYFSAGNGIAIAANGNGYWQIITSTDGFVDIASVTDLPPATTTITLTAPFTVGSIQGINNQGSTFSTPVSAPGIYRVTTNANGLVFSYCGQQIGDTLQGVAFPGTNYFGSISTPAGSLNNTGYNGAGTISNAQTALSGWPVKWPGTSITSSVPLSAIPAVVPTNGGNASLNNVTALTFTGNGSGVTNVSATNLTGVLPVTQIPPSILLTNPVLSFTGGSNVLVNLAPFSLSPRIAFRLALTNNANLLFTNTFPFATVTIDYYQSAANDRYLNTNQVHVGYVGTNAIGYSSLTNTAAGSWATDLFHFGAATNCWVETIGNVLP